MEKANYQNVQIVPVNSCKMKRLLFYILRVIAFIFKAFSKHWYMLCIVKAHKMVGVNIVGMPAYIDLSAHVDSSGGLTINKGVGVSVGAIILTHDWSFLRRYKARNITPPIC